MQFNTAIAALMALVGQLLSRDQPPAREVRKVLVSLLAPFAPHVSEELWHDHLGEPGSVHTAPWP
jgi:leucyl-tRNA synthetase